MRRNNEYHKVNLAYVSGDFLTVFHPITSVEYIFILFLLTQEIITGPIYNALMFLSQWTSIISSLNTRHKIYIAFALYSPSFLYRTIYRPFNIQ